MLDSNEKRELEKCLSLSGYQLLDKSYQRKTPYFTHFLLLNFKTASVEVSDWYNKNDETKPQSIRVFDKLIAELKNRIEICNQHIMSDPPIEAPEGFTFVNNQGEWTLSNLLKRNITFTTDGKVHFNNSEYDGDTKILIKNLKAILEMIAQASDVKYANADYVNYAHDRFYSNDLFNWLEVNNDGSLKDFEFHFRLIYKRGKDSNNVIFANKEYSEKFILSVTSELVKISVKSESNYFPAVVEKTWEQAVGELSLQCVLKESREFVSSLPGYEKCFENYLSGKRWQDNCYFCGNGVDNCKCEAKEYDGLHEHCEEGSQFPKNDKFYGCKQFTPVMLDSILSFIDKRNIKATTFRTISVK